MKQYFFIVIFFSFTKVLGQSSVFYPVDFEDNNKYSSFSFLDSLIETRKIVLVGENHIIPTTSKITLKLIKLLSLKYKFNHIILEASHSQAFLSNLYLKMGNEDLIDSIIFLGNRVKHITAKNLYSFNNDLPFAKKIRFFGIDSESDSYTFFKALMSIFKLNGTPPPEISFIVSQINNLKYNQWFDKKLMFKYKQILSKNLIKYNKIYKGYLGEYFFDFDLIINNNVKNIESLRRDESMFQNFLKINQRYPNSKYFGSFGMDHTKPSKNQLNLWKLFNDYFHNKIFIINPFYEKLKVIQDDEISFLTNQGILRDTNLKKYQLEFSGHCLSDFTFIVINKIHKEDLELQNSCDILLFVKNQKQIMNSKMDR